MKGHSWESCKYSAKGRVGCCSEYYSCLNEKIAESGKYSKLTLQKNDGPVVSSTLFNHSHLNPGGVWGLEWPEDVALMSLINDKLGACWRCEFYEPKKGKQTEFGQLCKETVGGIEYTNRDLKIIET